ncbi:MAG: anti-sigma factor family protein [Candidatus Brocadiia bacterium]
MTTEQAREHLSAYLDGELDEPTRGAVEQALAADARLRAELEALRRTARLLGSLPRQSAPPGFARRVGQALGAEAPAPARPRRRWGPIALAAAACLAVGFLALFLGRPRHEPQQGRRADDEKPRSVEPRTPESEGRSAPRDKAVREEDADRAEDKIADVRNGAAARAKKAGPVEWEKDAEAPREPAPEAPRPARGKVGAARRAEAEAGGRGAGGRADDLEARDLASKAGQPVARPGAAQSVQAEVRQAPAPRDELLAAIQEPRPARQRRMEDEAAAPEEAAEGVLVARLAYDDLDTCLSEVREVLEDANVAYVVQPLGRGRFAVEAALPAPEARALLARFGAPAGMGRERRTMVPGVAAEPKPKPSAPEGGPRVLGEEKAEATARPAGPPPIRLLLRFQPRAGAEEQQGAPAEPQ